MTGRAATFVVEVDRRGGCREAGRATTIERDQILATLRAHEAELRRRGVQHAALFGSAARGEAGQRSDIDILVELDPSILAGVFDYVAITQYLADLFPVRVDVANRGGLKPLVRPRVERDAVYAF
jgi:uncharacterized protein